MSESRPGTPVTISREELYRQVWEKPMQRLATGYGVTGNGLAKICDRLNVPYAQQDWVDWLRANLDQLDPLANGPGGLWHNLFDVSTWSYRD